VYKTLIAAYKTYKDRNLDALFTACHAPGHSAYNAVERRMDPLSHDLSGLILSHDHFGSPLDLTSMQVVIQSLRIMM